MIGALQGSLVRRVTLLPRSVLKIAQDDLRGARPLLVASVLFAGLADLWLHASHGFTPAPDGVRWRWHVAALALLAVAPMAADLFGSDPGRAVGRSLPTGARVLALGRTCAVLVGLTHAGLALAAIDLVGIALWGNVPISRFGELLHVDGAGPRLAAVSGGFLGATVMLAMVLRSSTPALLLGAVIALVPAAIDGVSDVASRRDILQRFGAWHREAPETAMLFWLAAVTLMVLSGTMGLRGRTSRSAIRRGAPWVALHGLVVLAVVAIGTNRGFSRVLARVVPPAVTWEGASSRLCDLSVSPDRRWVGVLVDHGDGEGYARSRTLWAIDALDGSVKRLPDGGSYWKWLLDGERLHWEGPQWSRGGSAIGVRGGLVDPATARIETSPSDKAPGEAVCGGWVWGETTWSGEDGSIKQARFRGGPWCSYHYKRGFGNPRNAVHLILYGDPEGEVRVLDGRTGKSRPTGVRWSGWDTFVVGDHGASLLMHRREERHSPIRMELVDLGTLEVRLLGSVEAHHELRDVDLIWVDSPARALTWNVADGCWDEAFGDRRQHDLPAGLVGQISGGRWVSRDELDGAIHLHEPDGSIWKSVRSGSGETR